MTTVRQARPDDHDAVATIAADTWPDREPEDYVPEVFPEWVASDDESRRTVVAESDGTVVGVCRGQLLSADEAWLQGIRVAPDHRGEGHGRALTEHLVEWARDRGTVVARILVFDWNGPAMGQARAGGFEPVAACRFVRTTAGNEGEWSSDSVASAAAAWQYWTGSEARKAMRGLALDADVGWALSELTRETVAAASPIALVGDRTRAATVRLRTRRSEYRESTVADYAVAAWDGGLAPALFDAIRADAARTGVEETRILVPATPRHVSGAAHARTELGESTLVFAKDLTRR
ncbi:MAG: N-acetyltransferase family protein [Salinirussus sp.]